MLLCKSKKVIRTKGIPFPESKLSSASAKENFHQLYSKHCFFSYSFSLKLSLVFISRENSRLQGILLFPDWPRFCRLMKTRNRRYPRASGMDGVKSGESGAFLFSRPSQISGMVGDHSRQMKLRFVQSGTSAMDFALYQSLSQINMASLENTSDCYLESLAQEGRKNDMVFLVGFCLSRI